MGSRKGSNGVIDGEENAQEFLEKVALIDDFKPFIFQGLLSVTRVAKECGLNRDVFYTNPDIRDIHWPALIKRLEDEGVLKLRVAKPVEEMPHQPRRNAANDSRTKQIQEENEAVKAENRELRRRLGKLESIDEILHSTGRIPW